MARKKNRVAARKRRIELRAETRKKQGKKQRKRTARQKKKLSKLKRQADRRIESMCAKRVPNDDIRNNREVNALLHRWERSQDNEEKRTRILSDFLKNTDESNKWVDRMVSVGWRRDKAEQFYDLVSDDIYNQFRQKFHIPSDVYYQIVYEEEVSPNEVLRAMQKMMNDEKYDDAREQPDAQEVIDVLRLILELA